MPLHTPQQDHSPTHQPTLIPSTVTYLLTLTLAYDDQVEPIPAPDILGDLSLFLRASSLALNFNSLLVLPVEGNSNDSTVIGGQQSQLTSYQWRKVGLSEKEREWPMGSQSSYDGDSPVQRNSTGPPATVTVLPNQVTTSTQCFQKGYLVRIFALGPIPHLVYVPLDRPSCWYSTSQPYHPRLRVHRPHALHRPPMLSIAKLIMRRHVRIAFFRFPFVNLAHITSSLLVAVFPDDALNLPSPSPLPHPRRHVFVAGIAVSTSGHMFPLPPNTTRGPLLYAYDRQRDQATSPSTSGTCTTPATRNAHSPATL